MRFTIQQDGDGSWWTIRVQDHEPVSQYRTLREAVEEARRLNRESGHDRAFRPFGQRNEYVPYQ